MNRSPRARSTVLIILLNKILLVAVALFVLRLLGIHLPLGALIAVVVMLGVWLFMGYKLIVPLFNRKQITGSEGMLGLKGKVITPLTPNGYIKIGGELWQASSTETNINIGEEVVVVGIEGLRLIVKREKDG